MYRWHRECSGIGSTTASSLSMNTFPGQKPYLLGVINLMSLFISVKNLEMFVPTHILVMLPNTSSLSFNPLRQGTIQALKASCLVKLLTLKGQRGNYHVRLLETYHHVQYQLCWHSLGQQQAGYLSSVTIRKGFGQVALRTLKVRQKI